MSLYRYFLLSAVSIFLIACTTEAPVDIEKAYWKTTVHLEELQVVRDASWHSEIPSDAYGIETYSKQRASIKYLSTVIGQNILSIGGIQYPD